MSKGSDARPLSVSKSEFDARWEATFGKSRVLDHEGERKKNAVMRAALDAVKIACNPPHIMHEDGSTEKMDVVTDPQLIRAAFEGDADADD